MQKNNLPVYRMINTTKEYYPVILVYSIIISFLTLATPISVQSLVNTFSLGPYLQPLFILSLILFGLLILLGIVKSLQYLMVEYLQRSLYAKFTSNIVRSFVLKNSSGVVDKNNLTISNRYFDIIVAQKTLAFLVTDILAILLQTFLGVILISFYHPMFIILSIIILVSVFVPFFFFNQKSKDSAYKESSAKHDVAAFIDTLAIQVPSEDKTSIDEQISLADNEITKYLLVRSKHFSYLFKQNIIYIVLYAFLNALLLGLGGYLVIVNQLTIGQLVAAEIVVNSILYHFLYAQKVLETFYDMHASLSKIEVFYEHLESLKENEIEYEAEESKFFKSLKSVRAIYNPYYYKKILRNFFMGLTAVAILLALTPWQQTSRGQGRVVAFDPNNRIQNLTSTINGRIEDWLIQEGTFVKKGDPIVKVVDNDPDFLSRLEANRDAAIAKFEAAKTSSNTGRLNFHRQDELVKEGLSSPKDAEKAKITYQKLLAEEAAALALLTKAETELSRQMMQTVTAPRNGRVQRILHGSGSVNVKVGDVLAEFVPSTEEKAVEIFLDGNDLPLLVEGRKVRIQFEGWPSVQFSGWPSVAVGSFGGVVKLIDPSVSENGYFRVLVTPDKDDPEEWPVQKVLRQGSRAMGLVLLDEVSLGYEFWRKINGFPKSNQNAPRSIRKKGDK